MELDQIDFESYPTKTIKAPACEQTVKTLIPSDHLLDKFTLFICTVQLLTSLAIQVIRIRSCTFFFPSCVLLFFRWNFVFPY